MYIDYINVFTKRQKRIGDLDTNNRYIQPGYRKGIWHRKLCHAHGEKAAEEINLLNQESIRALRD